MWAVTGCYIDSVYDVDIRTYCPPNIHHSHCQVLLMHLGMYLILYSIGRFFLECFRGDPRGSVGVLSTSQFIAIFILAVGIAVYLYCTKKYLKNASEKTEEN